MHADPALCALRDAVRANENLSRNWLRCQLPRRAGYAGRWAAKPGIVDVAGGSNLWISSEWARNIAIDLGAFVLVCIIMIIFMKIFYPDALGLMFLTG